jgi:hydrogenase maturation protease
MDGYELLVIVDAVARGGPPGQLYVLELALPATSPTAYEAWQADLVDMHETVPAKALVMARALGVLPGRALVVGCQPAVTEEPEVGLSAPVAAAVDRAVARIWALLDPGAALKRRDEVLQVLFWLQGEGLGPAVAAADVTRFLGDDAAVGAALAGLAEDGYVQAEPEAAGSVRYRLTPAGEAEGRRRFLDEFEPYLARRAHGECGAADCDCHQGGAECRGLA